MKNPLWTEEETRLLKELYPKHGGTWEGWAEALPGRTLRAIYRRAYQLGVSCDGTRNQTGAYPRWTPEEIEILKEHYPMRGESWEGWADLLPGRNQRSIGQKAHTIGITYVGPHKGKGRMWTQAEDEAVRTYYPAHGKDWIGWTQHLPGRSAHAISDRANDLCVRRDFDAKRAHSAETLSKRGYVVVNQHTGMWDAAQLKQLELLVRACPEVTGHTAYESAHMMLQLLEV